MSPRTLYLLQTRPEGKIIALDPDTGSHRVILDGMDCHPDGIAVDVEQQVIYWTNMGVVKEAHTLEFFQADGSVERIGLDGTGRTSLVGLGLMVTGKQLFHDRTHRHLYWCDREGMRVMRSDEDGGNVTVLVQTGLFPRDAHDYTRHCVGIAVDLRHGVLYWTQKGPSKGGQGRILRVGLALPEGQTASNRTDIEVMIDGLPEPIDLEIDHDRGVMYWTDRGDKARQGNTLNRATIGPNGFQAHEVLATGLDEGIALACDFARDEIFITDLGGNVHRYDLTRGGALSTVATFGALTGICFGH